MVFEGTITMTYIIEADNEANAQRGLENIAQSLLLSGVLGAASGGVYDQATDTFAGGYDARIKSAKPTEIAESGKLGSSRTTRYGQGE
jgi:hypothetical protein